MSKHYKKLILLLIPACAGFCLALALGAAEETSELCHLCTNKALVKEAILAFNEDPYDESLPEQFDPNYVQYGPRTPCQQQPYPHFSPKLGLSRYDDETLTFDSIIAEGDMVSVLLSLVLGDSPLDDDYFIYVESATYRISNGKIVEGRVFADWWYSHWND